MPTKYYKKTKEGSGKRHVKGIKIFLKQKENKKRKKTRKRY